MHSTNQDILYFVHKQIICKQSLNVIPTRGSLLVAFSFVLWAKVILGPADNSCPFFIGTGRIPHSDFGRKHAMDPKTAWHATEMLKVKTVMEFVVEIKKVRK